MNVAADVQPDADGAVPAVLRAVITVCPQKISCGSILQHHDIKAAIGSDRITQDQYVAVPIDGQGSGSIVVVARTIQASGPFQYSRIGIFQRQKIRASAVRACDAS